MQNNSQNNLVSLWKGTKMCLESAKIPSPTIDARILLTAAAEVTRNDLVTDPYRVIAPEKIEKLNHYIERRLKREPVAHIVGKKAFWSLELLSDTRALVPRPETEVIVDSVLKALPEEAAMRILDIGTGSGAILLALLAERKTWSGIGTDMSEAALSLALENANLHSLENRAQFVKTHWAEGITESFDIIVSNPPYIPSGDIEGLDIDVKHFDPISALDGGQTGLSPYPYLFEHLKTNLKPGGIFLFEFGINQSAQILEMAKNYNYIFDLKIIKDLSGIDRVIMGKRDPS